MITCGAITYIVPSSYSPQLLEEPITTLSQTSLVVRRADTHSAIDRPTYHFTTRFETCISSATLLNSTQRDTACITELRLANINTPLTLEASNSASNFRATKSSNIKYVSVVCLYIAHGAMSSLRCPDYTCERHQQTMFRALPTQAPTAQERQGS